MRKRALTMLVLSGLVIPPATFQTAGAATRSVTKSYVGPIGDLTTFNCSAEGAPGVGGACFSILFGELTVLLTIDDLTGFATGGQYQFYDAVGSPLLPTYPSFCGATPEEIPIPAGAVSVTVYADEALAILDCSSATAAATTGTITAVFSTDPPPVLPAPLFGDKWTVVAVVDSGFSPYHYDFLGSQHPRNTDSNPGNNFNFSTNPATYIDGYPGSTPIQLTIPTAPDQDVSGLRFGDDAAAWGTFQPSTSSDVNLYRFPGTKVIGALSFEGQFYDTNDGHGTRSAASAAGNIHGTCPECLVVLIKGSTYSALAWAASQPWIDVVTNSYGHSVVGGPVRDNIFFGAPVAETKAASEAGQTIVFSAGNGLLNAFDVPMFTYWSSEKGPDWMVTVGAAEGSTYQQFSGAGKPVDISSIGDGYPSAGGTEANGYGEHSGTSNAAPVTAGTFAKVIQRARELLGDASETHTGGIVASGTPVACGSTDPGCPLSDGVLTRAELQDVVFRNVLPSPSAVTIDTTWPSTEYNYYYQGHGVIIGRSKTPEAFTTEQARFSAALTGAVAPYTRPAGETNWFIIDSKCRQKIWGSWSGGSYTGADPALDLQADPIATIFNTWCSALPVGFG